MHPKSSRTLHTGDRPAGRADLGDVREEEVSVVAPPPAQLQRHLSMGTDWSRQDKRLHLSQPAWLSQAHGGEL